ncbi:ion channel [Deinococcus sonorensis]|uniref:Ion channel n=2 Tax=Deinococcus sonorensis TaxID=309891 RepID=A0AAU7UBZ5_9DEIO
MSASGAEPPARPAAPDLNADLGLGGAVAQSSGERFLNRDGSFNVERRQVGLQGINVYGELLTVGWGRFFVLMAAAYLGLNAVFAAAYDVMGPSALSAMPGHGLARFLACFFFSVQTFGTIGFGHVYPASLAANLMVTVEAFVGLLGVALATGLLFARFSRPTHRLRFSERAVIAPYQDGQALMFRVTNAHRTQLVDLSAEVTFSHFEQASEPGGRTRRFYPLALERHRVTFFPTSWTIVHALVPGSPLWGQTPQSLAAGEAELLVVLRATDDASHGQIHARTSYRADELRWNARFRPMHRTDEAGHLWVDLSRLSDTEPVPAPAADRPGQ